MRKLNFFLALALSLSALTVESANLCSSLLSFQKNKTLNRDFVAQLSNDLDPNEGKSFSVLDTTVFFPEGLSRQIFESLPRGYSINIDSELGNINRITRLGIAKDLPNLRLGTEDGKKFMDELIFSTENLKFDIPTGATIAATRFASWLLRTLNTALAPQERLKVSQIEYRTIGRDQDTHWNKRSDFIHQDGGDFTATISLVGSGTLYTGLDVPQLKNMDSRRLTELNPSGVFEVPRGQTLIISGENRQNLFSHVLATYHAAPSALQDRLLLLVRFKILKREK